MSDLTLSAVAARLQTESSPLKELQEPKKIARFGEVLTRMVHETDAQQTAAQAKLQAFERGEVKDVHEVMMEMNKSDLSFRMMLEMRGKLLEAYQTIMRLQV